MIVLAAAQNHALQRMFAGWLPDLKKARHGLLLMPDRDLDGDLLGIKLPRQQRATPPGRGTLAVRGRSQLVQVAR